MSNLKLTTTWFDGRLQYLKINGTNKGSYMLPYTTTWSNFNFGYHKLTQGVNTIEIKAGWGFAYFDTVTVDYADLDPLEVQPILSDPLMTPETQLLMNYLGEESRRDCYCCMAY